MELNSLVSSISSALKPEPSDKNLRNRHPERFDKDGTRRMIRFFDSSLATMKGTLESGPPQATDSRQVRRAKIRVLFFNRLTFNPIYGAAQREMRRLWARKARVASGS